MSYALLAFLGTSSLVSWFPNIPKSESGSSEVLNISGKGTEHPQLPVKITRVIGEVPLLRRLSAVYRIGALVCKFSSLFFFPGNTLTPVWIKATGSSQVPMKRLVHNVWCFSSLPTIFSHLQDSAEMSSCLIVSLCGFPSLLGISVSSFSSSVYNTHQPPCASLYFILCKPVFSWA